MDERARKIFEAAYAALDRTAAIPRHDEREREISDYIKSCLEPDWTPPAPRVRMQRDTVPQLQDWELGARIAAALEAYSKSVGIAIATINKRNKKAFNAKIHWLEGEIQKLREAKGTHEIVHSEALMRVVK